MSNEPEGQWCHEDLPRFRDALTLTEAETGFSSRLIEKDYYCSLLLADLSGPFEQGLVFKGGTCLSKVHAEFFRLSEDLDFSISLRPDAPRSERRAAVSPIKDHLSGVPGRLTMFELAELFEGHHESRQYNGRFAYRSAVTGEREFIKVEVSLREDNLLPPEVLLARTLLRDPHSAQPVLSPVNVRVLQLREAYSEKIRAALTRREPAIRDFFDIDHAVRNALFGCRDQDVLDLLAAKLAVAGNEPVDLSEAKIAILRGQVESQLRPVLRVRDYELFDLQRVLLVLEDMVRLYLPSELDRPDRS
jgi:predicted nucleotidyltransferase component of viral defense system